MDERIKITIILLGIGILLILGVHVAFLQRELQPIIVICENGSNYVNEKRMGDEYYHYSLKCNLGNSNGQVTEVVVID